MIPKTTQTPNCIFDKWMAILKGGELKVLLCVVRHTLGWVENKKTGRRKELDSITHQEIVEMSGITRETIAKALVVLADKHDLIQVIDENGALLNSPTKRRAAGAAHKQLFYRLGVSIPIEQSENLTGKESENLTQVLKKNKNKEKQTSEDKPRNGTFPAEWYRQNEKDYQEIKGVELTGKEFGALQRDLKLMYESGHSPDEIRSLMKAFEVSKERWTDNWTHSTVRNKMPYFVAGKLSLGESSSANPRSEIEAQCERLRKPWNECSYNIQELRDEAERHNRPLSPDEHSEIAALQEKQKEYEERGLRLKERLESL